MNEELSILISNLKEGKNLLSLDNNKSDIKRTVVLKILAILNWDFFSLEDIHEWEDIYIDYSLRYKGIDRVFIKVRKITETLQDYQKEFLDYSFKAKVNLAILTNGIKWLFYLPLKEGSCEERNFYTIDLFKQENDVIVEKFVQLLSKDSIISDDFLDIAENLYQDKKKDILIKNTLPVAFEKMLSEPDEFLIEIFADKIEELCGLKPDDNKIILFFKEIKERLTKEHDLDSEKIDTGFKLKLKNNVKGYSYKKIIAFTFKNNRYTVRFWRELLIKITEIMFYTHRDEFHKVFEISGKRRKYFSKKSRQLRRPRRIGNSDIFIETSFSANDIVNLSQSIIRLFGYKDEDLIIEAEEKL